MNNTGQELKSEVVLTVKVIPRNETPAVKAHRLIRAVVKEFAKEHPQEALRIVQEEVKEVVKS